MGIRAEGACLPASVGDRIYERLIIGRDSADGHRTGLPVRLLRESRSANI
jgi:hypothetical protein